MDRKHPPNDDLLLLYILVATQVELSFQLTSGLSRETLVNTEKATQSKKKASHIYASSKLKVPGRELSVHQRQKQAERQRCVTAVSWGLSGEELQG